MKMVCLSLSEQNQAITPTMNHQGKKEKAEPVESLSQRRDQFEGDMSQLSERSVSSPTTQTLSSSPTLKAFFFNKDPRVGKTITATLVCEELGFTYIEMNASDTRSKKTLEEHISHSLSNKTMDGFLTGQKADPSKHVLLMDEVDGMAGNEDRGGMQELISLIKSSKIPVICMCNDRNSPKMRSLANHCFDLRFQRPRVEQIKGAMMSIAFKEGLKIPPQAMEQIILGANQDVRQVLHNLSMWTAKEKSLNYDQAKEEAAKAQKDIKMGAFDAVRRLLSGAESSKMNLIEKSDMFFCDYSMMPLFMQENYLMVDPSQSRGDIKKTLSLVSQTADSICDGDLVEKLIRQGGNWSMLPMQAMFSCVIPSTLISGGMGQRIEFPQWLGKNSKYGRMDRMLQELKGHMRLSTSGSKLSMNMDYIPHLRKVLTRPLMTQESDQINPGVSRVMQVMENYDLTKEDWDSIIEVGQFEGQRDPVASIPSKVKAAFTRTYNKESFKTPYAIRAAPKKGRRGGAEDEQMMEEAGEGDASAVEPQNDDNDDLENNPMIKASKKPAKAAASGRSKGGKSKESVKKEAPTSKGKGRGKNRK